MQKNVDYESCVILHVVHLLRQSKSFIEVLKICVALLFSTEILSVLMWLNTN